MRRLSVTFVRDGRAGRGQEVLAMGDQEEAPGIPKATPEAEVEIEAALVARLIAAQHPEFAALPLRAFGHGWDNAMFRLGDDWLVRLPRREVAAKLVEHEAEWLPRLAPNLPLAIPAPVRRGAPGEGYPWRWTVVPWIEGDSADRAPVPASEADRFADFLDALHRTAPKDAPENPVRGVPLAHRAELTEPRFDRLRRTTDVMTPVIDALWRTALEADVATEATWLHGDLHPGNVLVHAGRIAGVIDWGDITTGDPACDLASIWLLFADPRARARLVARVATDAATLDRARGWAVAFAAVFLDTGLSDDPRMAAIGRRTFDRLEADASRRATD